MGNSNSNAGTVFDKNRSACLLEHKDRYASNTLNKSPDIPQFAQSALKANNSKYSVELINKVFTSVQIGLSTICLDKNATCWQEYAQEFVYLDCGSGIVHSHCGQVRPKGSSNYKKDHKISVEMNGEFADFELDGKKIC